MFNKIDGKLQNAYKRELMFIFGITYDVFYIKGSKLYPSDSEPGLYNEL